MLCGEETAMPHACCVTVEILARHQWPVSSLSSDVCAGVEAVGPCVLEVETSGDTVHVDNFSGKIQAGHELALHGFEVDLVE